MMVAEIFLLTGAHRARTSTCGLHCGRHSSEQIAERKSSIAPCRILPDGPFLLGAVERRGD
jgi:hypothetical protein